MAVVINLLPAAISLNQGDINQEAIILVVLQAVMYPMLLAMVEMVNPHKNPRKKEVSSLASFQIQLLVKQYPALLLDKFPRLCKVVVATIQMPIKVVISQVVDTLLPEVTDLVVLLEVAVEAAQLPPKF